METLSLAAARRVALRAQGLTSPRPLGRVDRGHVRRLFDRLGCLQIDSVNVLVRAHEMPLFARLGPHSRALLPGLAARNEVFEYWGHQASLIPTELYPLFRWRMDKAGDLGSWASVAELNRRRPEFIELIYKEVEARGPVSASDIDPNRTGGTWWSWNDAKRALEYLFFCGRLAVQRTPTFERLYDVTERVIPPSALAPTAPSEADAKRELLRLAARALGVATDGDLAAYWNLRKTTIRPRLAELVEAGALIPVQVEGWRDTAYLEANAVVPRRADVNALVSPFDPLVWERPRLERLFDFHYRIEIYVPAPQRVFGYYVLPYVFGDRFVARVDLRADRKRSVLEVRSAWEEPHLDLDGIDALAAELRFLADWLALETIEVADKGDLAPVLHAEIAALS
jgi:uncharacterized protein YcaQ